MVTLNLPESYAWRKLLHLYNNSHTLEPTEYSDPKTETFAGIVQLTRPLWFILQRQGPKLHLSLSTPTNQPPPQASDYAQAQQWVIQRFWLDLDFSALRQALERSFLGYSLSEEFWPVVSPAYSSYWASLLRLYCGKPQELRLRQALGDRVAFANRDYWLLPTPQQMASVGLAQLKALGFSSWSSSKIPHLTHTYLQDPGVHPQHLPTDVYSALRLLQKRIGLGNGSAAWVLMRGALNPDVALDGTHIRRMLAQGTGLSEIPKPKEYAQLMQVHAPFRSFVSYYLHLSALKGWRKGWNLEG